MDLYDNDILGDWKYNFLDKFMSITSSVNSISFLKMYSRIK
jgi:hypothetical protein